MKILVLGMGLFVGELRQMGHEVVTCGCSYGHEVLVPPESFSVPEIMAALDGWLPDICLFTETLGNRTFPAGLQSRPFPLVYYSIDTHLNFFWLRHFATTCDAVLTTQKDYVPLLQEHVPRAFWLPWANNPDEYYDLDVERDIPISFVGAVDDYRPRRKSLLTLIKAHYPIEIFAERLLSEDVNAIYSRSKIVINEAIAGEVNFRVFEAMASGPLLLTDCVGNGLTDLFQDGRHLVTFGPDDVLEKIGYYLAHDNERRTIAASGKLLVHAEHTRTRRVKLLDDILNAIPSVPAIRPSRLGKAYFLMLRRGILGEYVGLSLAYQTTMEEASACTTGERLADLAALLTAYGDGDAGPDVFRRTIESGCIHAPLLLQWSLVLLDDKKDDEAWNVLQLLCGFLHGDEQRSLAEALSLSFPSVEVFLFLASLAENGLDPSVPGFVQFRGRAVPFSGLDVIAIGLSRFSGDPRLLELQGDISMNTYAPLSAADMYLQAVSRQPSGRLLRKAAAALSAAFMAGEAAEAAHAASTVLGEEEGGVIPYGISSS